MENLNITDLEKKYSEIIAYMYAHLPMFTRVGHTAYKKDLHNIRALALLDNNPHTKYKTIHVGGTNGKGSTSHFIASILQAQGLRVGIFTSPHYVDFRERMKINGKYISKREVIEYIEKNKDEIERTQPSFFEITAAMAFWYFAKQNVDVAIIEVGLGGRLDSTNIIQPALSVITHIAFDHMNMLGNTLELIANEKAGIIKPNTPVVIGKTQSDIQAVFTNKAVEYNSSISFADQHYTTETVEKTIQKQVLNVYREGKIFIENLHCPLLGEYQQQNMVTALQSIEMLTAQGWNISTNAIRNGIEQIKTNTNIFGRFDVWNTKPYIIADSAHNEDGIKAVMQQIMTIEHKQLHIVWGNVHDKDIEKMLELLPQKAIYYFCKPNIPRGLDTELLQSQANLYQLKGNTYQSVYHAYTSALQNASPDDILYIGGSTFVVAELYEHPFFYNQIYANQ